MSDHSEDIETIVHDVVESKQLREQPFRIYRVIPELNKVTVYARHIFYDLLDNFIRTYTQGQGDRGAEVVKGILRNHLPFGHVHIRSTFEGSQVNPAEKVHKSKP